MFWDRSVGETFKRRYRSVSEKLGVKISEQMTDVNRIYPSNTGEINVWKGSKGAPSGGCMVGIGQAPEGE